MLGPGRRTLTTTLPYFFVLGALLGAGVYVPPARLWHVNDGTKTRTVTDGRGLTSTHIYDSAGAFAAKKIQHQKPQHVR